jgi:hypothetical protein
MDDNTVVYLPHPGMTATFRRAHMTQHDSEMLALLRTVRERRGLVGFPNPGQYNFPWRCPATVLENRTDYWEWQADHKQLHVPAHVFEAVWLPKDCHEHQDEPTAVVVLHKKRRGRERRS